MLLVDDDEAEIAHRREDRRPGPDNHPGLTSRDPVALVTTLGLPEGRVQNRDRRAEALSKAADRLRGEGDLGDEHDRAEPARERSLARLEIDLRLATPCRPDEQQMRSTRICRSL